MFQIQYHYCGYFQVKKSFIAMIVYYIIIRSVYSKYLLDFLATWSSLILAVMNLIQKWYFDLIMQFSND